MTNSAIQLKEMLVLQNAVNSCKDILYTIQAPLCSFCDICLTPLKRMAETDMARFKTKPANIAIVATGHFTSFNHRIDGFRLLCSN